MAVHRPPSWLCRCVRSGRAVYAVRRCARGQALAAIQGGSPFCERWAAAADDGRWRWAATLECVGRMNRGAGATTCVHDAAFEPATCLA